MKPYYYFFILFFLLFACLAGIAVYFSDQPRAEFMAGALWFCILYTASGLLSARFLIKFCDRYIVRASLKWVSIIAGLLIMMNAVAFFGSFQFLTVELIKSFFIEAPREMLLINRMTHAIFIGSFAISYVSLRHVLFSLDERDEEIIKDEN